MEAVKRNLDRLIGIVAGVSMGVVFVVTFIQVISRYCFQLNVPWSTDIIRITFIYTVFFGASIGMKEKGHLCMDLFMNMLSPRAQIYAGVIINVVLIAFLLFIVVYGIQFTLGATAQSMPYLQIPISLLYAAIPLNAAFMIFYLGLHIAGQIKELSAPKA